MATKTQLRRWLLKASLRLLFCIGVTATAIAFGFLAVTLLKQTTSLDDVWIVHSEAIAGGAAFVAVICLGVHLSVRLYGTRR